MSRTFTSSNRGCARFGPILIGMAPKTSVHAIDQITATLQSRGGYFELSISQCALLSADDGPPSDGERDAETEQCNQQNKDYAYDFCPTSSCHVSPMIQGQ